MAGQLENNVESMLRNGLAEHRAGRLSDAAVIYEAVLEMTPDHPEATQLLGVVHLQARRFLPALACLERAYRLSGGELHIARNLAEACLAAGERQRALLLLQEAMLRFPENDALKALAVRALSALAEAAEAKADWSGAVDLYRQLLPLSSQQGAILCNLGNALLNVGQIPEARQHLEAAIRAVPEEMAAWHNLARVRAAQGEFESAAQAYAAAQALAPDNAQNALAWLDLWIEQQQWQSAGEVAGRLEACFAASAEFLSRAGRIALEQGRCGEAERCWQKLRALQPRHAEVRNNLARLALDRMDLLNARQLCEEAVRIDPGLAEAWLNLGLARHHLDDTQGASTAYRKAIDFSRGHPDKAHVFRLAHLSLGRVAMDEGDCERALPWLITGGAQESSSYEGMGNYVDALLRVADWGSLACLIGEGDLPAGINPFTALALTDDPAIQQQCARAYAGRMMADAQPWRPTDTGSPERPIRLGYLSSDLHAHATAYLMADLFESHDRARFRVYAYSSGVDDGSTMRQRMVQAFDVFRDLRGRSIDAIQQQIREDGIDILIDLKGYTFRALPGVLAGRPAPLQLSYLGYPGTLGCVALDYILADGVVLPEAAQDFLDEAALRLPVCYQPQDRYWQAASGTTRAEHGLPEGRPVLACFNQVYKISQDIFEDWLEIMHAVPEALLWLIEPGAAARRQLLRAAEEDGVAAERIIFAPLLPHPEHLARVALADVFLDTFPYGAHTTASDALRRGVPVVTRCGRTFASRVAASLLQTLDLPELVVETRADYIWRVVELARLPEARQAIATRLAAGLPHLMDVPRFMQHYEGMLSWIWARHRQNLPPAAYTGHALSGGDLL